MKKDKYLDWGCVDWSLSNQTIAEILGTSRHYVKKVRDKIDPFHCEGTLASQFQTSIRRHLPPITRRRVHKPHKIHMREFCPVEPELKDIMADVAGDYTRPVIIAKRGFTCPTPDEEDCGWIVNAALRRSNNIPSARW